MANYAKEVTNGVSLGTLLTAIAADATNGWIQVTFTDVDYWLVASILVVDANDEVVDLGDAVVTYPAVGVIRIANGNSLFTVTSGYKFSIIAQRRV